jgi:hypothetical protein
VTAAIGDGEMADGGDRERLAGCKGDVSSPPAHFGVLPGG